MKIYLIDKTFKMTLCLLRFVAVISLSFILLGPIKVFAESQEHTSPILALPFENATADKTLDGLKGGIPDILTAFLSPYSDKIQFVDRKSLTNIYQEQGLDFEGLIAKDSVFAVGTMVQAQYVMRGSYRKVKGQLSIDVLLYDTQTTQLIKSFTAIGEMKSVSRVCEALAYDISSFLKIGVKKIENLPADEDPLKNALMIEGLGFYYNGQYPLALAQFIKVLEMDDSDQQAALMLAKSYQQAGMTNHAVIEYESFLKKFPESSKNEEVGTWIADLKDQSKGQR